MWRVKKHGAFDLSKELTVLSPSDKAAHPHLLAPATLPYPASACFVANLVCQVTRRKYLVAAIYVAAVAPDSSTGTTSS